VIASAAELIGTPCKVRRSSGEITDGRVSDVCVPLEVVIVDVGGGMAKQVPFRKFLAVNPVGFDALR